MHYYVYDYHDKLLGYFLNELNELINHVTKLLGKQVGNKGIRKILKSGHGRSILISIRLPLVVLFTLCMTERYLEMFLSKRDVLLKR
ncbi:hypothetical protein TUMEXPCC7403_05125 [Tumidithrix helvetica PCC 7403]